jgi:two-component system, sensor histidine kinase and response regulator
MGFGKSDIVAGAEIPHLAILVVDDDELNRRMMHILLSREGHQVELASNGLEAFNMIKSKKFDIVFMDLQMPIMDGVEASQKIREWENGDARTFIVALTASYLPERGEKLFEAGIDNYIPKPFELEHIQRMLKYRSDAILASTLHVKPTQNEEISIREVLDFEQGVKRVGGNVDTYWELLGDFIQELPEKMEAMQRYFAARDLDGLSRAAHNLKGVSANLGILQLSEYADRLDTESSSGYTDLIGETLKEVKAVGGKLGEIAQIFLSARNFHAE